jgi:type I restriction enzyme S subunit
MQPTLKSHLNNKPSGIPWVDTIPSHWAVRTLRSILRPVNERNHADLPLLSVVREQGVILRDLDNTDDNHNVIPEDLSNYKLVRPKQFAINKMKAWQGSYGVSLHEGIVSPAYFVFDVLDIDPAFLHRATRSKAYVPLFDRASDGVRIGQWDLSHEHLRDIPIAIPPLNEQAAIVRYIDHADELINRYISTKERLIALLEEQRQAVIHQAVTRGLDLNEPLKDSGFHWPCDVPQHWQLQRLKTLCSMKSGDGITTESIEPEGPYPVYGGNGIRGYSRSYTHEGQFVLIGRQGALCGNIHRASGKFWASEHAVVASLHTGHSLDWFVPLLETMNLNQYSIAAAQPGLSVERVMNLSVPVPPSEEQTKIAEIINQADTRIGSTVSQVQRQIDLMNEYRTRLIADAVTGLIDVRNAPVKLPGQHL